MSKLANVRAKMEFERWGKQRGWNLSKSFDFRYNDKATNDCWIGWRACSEQLYMPMACIRCGQDAGPNRYACPSCYEDMLEEGRTV